MRRFGRRRGAGEERYTISCILHGVSERLAGGGEWESGDVRALRERLGDSQQAFAERLGTRQQTISEWERGASRPRSMARRLLTLIAEQAPRYDVERAPGDDAG
jgi:DNA-binding XRE family transcriptional regulator